MGIDAVTIGQKLLTPEGACVVLSATEDYSQPGSYTAGLIGQLEPLVIKHIRNSAPIAEVQEVIGKVEIPDIIQAIERGLEQKLVYSKNGEITLDYLRSLPK